MYHTTTFYNGKQCKIYVDLLTDSDLYDVNMWMVLFVRRPVVVICAVMQAGFAMVEVGSTGTKHTKNILIKVSGAAPRHLLLAVFGFLRWSHALRTYCAYCDALSLVS